MILSKSAPDIDWKVRLCSELWYANCYKKDSELQVELSPVDFIADSIVKITMNVKAYFGKKFNFINSNTMDCR